MEEWEKEKKEGGRKKEDGKGKGRRSVPADRQIKINDLGLIYSNLRLHP